MARRAELGAFVPLREIDGVYIARKAGLRCSALVLTGGDVCLFSPVQGLGAEAISSLAEIGPVTHLLAPNHYHNKGLAEYLSAFPDACLCAPEAAMPRLKKVTGLAFESMDEVRRTLPDFWSILQPDGLKTGEVWLRCDVKRQCSWFVVDAISGPDMTSGNDRADVPSLLKTFPNFGVKDKPAYIDWLKRQVGADSPDLIVPCHGSIIDGPDLAAKLLALVDENF